MGIIIPTSLPAFSYTGSYTTELRADWGWVIRFMTDGVLTFTQAQKVDLYLHGGGGGGGGSYQYGGGGGGGGSLATHKSIQLAAGTPYTIRVGAGGSGGGINSHGAQGGSSSAFGYSVIGGYGGEAGNDDGPGGGAGGSGSGGHGGNSTGGYGWPGSGNSVREFGGNSSWPVYGGGGGGGAPRYGGIGAGGSPHGALGGQPAANNTGGGGGGGNFENSGCKGGSGIVCIRNSEILTLPVVFNGTELTRLIHNGTSVGSLIFDGMKLFFRRLTGKEAAHGAVYGTG